jgi:hypothetical protein
MAPKRSGLESPFWILIVLAVVSLAARLILICR